MLGIRRYVRCFFVKLLGSPIIYVHEIFFPVYVTFNIPQNTTLFPINSLIYKISL